MTVVLYKLGRRNVRLQIHHNRVIKPIVAQFPSLIRAQQFVKEKLQ